MAIATGWARPSILFEDEHLMPLEPMAISIDGSSSIRRAQKFSNGKLVTAGTAEGETTFVMTVGIQAMTWAAWQFGLGQLATKETLITLPKLESALLPLSGAAEVTNADIVDDEIHAAIASKGAWGQARPLTKVAGAPASADEFQVDAGTNKLIFHSSLAGARVIYRLMKGYANWDAIGVSATPTLLNNLSFDGEIFGDDESGNQLFHVAAASRTSSPSINPNDVTQVQMTYELQTTTENPLPFVMVPKAA